MENEEWKALQEFKSKVFTFITDCHDISVRISDGLCSEHTCRKNRALLELGVLSANLYNFMDMHFPEDHTLDE